MQEAEGRPGGLSAQCKKLTGGELAEAGAALGAEPGASGSSRQRSKAPSRTSSPTCRSAWRKAEQGPWLHEAIGTRTGRHRAGGAHCRAQGIRGGPPGSRWEGPPGSWNSGIYKVQAGHDRGCAHEMEATIAHTAGELDRVRKSMQGLTAEFGDRDAELPLLLETYGEAIGPRMPGSLPAAG